MVHLHRVERLGEVGGVALDVDGVPYPQFALSNADKCRSDMSPLVEHGPDELIGHGWPPSFVHRPYDESRAGTRGRRRTDLTPHQPVGGTASLAWIGLKRRISVPAVLVGGFL